MLWLLIKSFGIKSLVRLIQKRSRIGHAPSCGKTNVGASITMDSIDIGRTRFRYHSDEFKKEDFEERSFLGYVIAFATAYEKLQFVQHKFIGFLICENCGESIVFGGRAECTERNSQSTDLPERLGYIRNISHCYYIFLLLDDRYPAERSEKLYSIIWTLHLTTQPPLQMQYVKVSSHSWISWMFLNWMVGKARLSLSR